MKVLHGVDCVFVIDSLKKINGPAVLIPRAGRSGAGTWAVKVTTAG